MRACDMRGLVMLHHGCDDGDETVYLQLESIQDSISVIKRLSV